MSTPDGRTPPGDQLDAIRARVLELPPASRRVFRKRAACPRWPTAGCMLCDWRTCDPGRRRTGFREFFEEQIFPVLTPLAVDPAHPFPYISNLSLNLAVLVRDPRSRRARFARVKVPARLLERFVRPRTTRRFVPIEQVIGAHLDRPLPGHGDRRPPCRFRVTRDADLDIEEDEADDLLAAIEPGCARRLLGRGVRLEVDRGDAATHVLRPAAARSSSSTTTTSTSVAAPLDLGGLWRARTRSTDPSSRTRPLGAATRARTARAQRRGEPRDIFAVLREGDVLVHHPYDSFETLGRGLPRARPPRIPRCWPSSTPSTAPRARETRSCAR